MKQTNSLIVVLLACLSLSWTPAPEVYRTATVVYDIHLQDEKMSWLVRANISTGSLTIYFTEQWIRTDFESLFLDQINIMEGSQHKGLILVQKIGGRQAYPMAPADLDDQNRERGQVVIKHGPKTKTIMGFECKEAFVTTERNEEIHVFYTEQLRPHNTDSPYTIKDLPGLPLEMHLVRGTHHLDLMADKIKVNEVKSDLLFLSPPKGYDLKTYADYKAMTEARAKGDW